MLKHTLGEVLRCFAESELYVIYRWTEMVAMSYTAEAIEVPEFIEVIKSMIEQITDERSINGVS